jgi:cytoskeletal protein RodZ
MAIVESARPDFGRSMKRMREERGVTLRQIADATKISVSALEALERNDISRLPGGLFSRAFVRSYATQVGLDPEQTVRDFLVQFPHDSVTIGSPHAQKHSDAIGSTKSRSESAFVGVVLRFAVFVGSILLMTLTN